MEQLFEFSIFEMTLDYEYINSVPEPELKPEPEPEPEGRIFPGTFSIYDVLISKKLPELFRKYAGNPGLSETIKQHISFGLVAYRTAYPDHNLKSIIAEFKQAVNRILTDLSDQEPGISIRYQALKESIYGYLNKFRESRQYTFDQVFLKSIDAKAVKTLFEYYGYSQGNKWIGKNGKISELRDAVHALSPVLKQNIPFTTIAKVFYTEYGLIVSDKKTSESYITKDTLRKPPLNPEIEVFEKVFRTILNKEE